MCAHQHTQTARVGQATQRLDFGTYTPHTQYYSSSTRPACTALAAWRQHRVRLVLHVDYLQGARILEALCSPVDTSSECRPDSVEHGGGTRQLTQQTRQFGANSGCCMHRLSMLAAAVKTYAYDATHTPPVGCCNFIDRVVISRPLLKRAQIILSTLTKIRGGRLCHLRYTGEGQDMERTAVWGVTAKEN